MTQAQGSAAWDTGDGRLHVRQAAGGARCDVAEAEVVTRGEQIIRLALVDGHHLVRQGVRALLDTRPQFEVVAEVPSLAVAKAVRVPVDVVVTDVELPDARDRDVVQGLAEVFEPAPVLALTLVDQPTRVQRVLAAGAAGYLLKTATLSDLEDAVRAIASGATYLQPSLGVELARRRNHGSDPKRGATASLTAMEQRVLRLLALGHTNAEAAQLIGVSVRTIESHRAQLSRKLGGRSRANLVQQARHLGLDEPEEARR